MLIWGLWQNFILNFSLRQHDLDSKKYPLVNLNEILTLAQINPTAIQDLVNDRIIVIADFVDRDLHETTYGKMAGALILVNVYLALVNSDNLVNISFFVMLSIGYLFISLIVFWPGSFQGKKLTRYLKHEKIFQYVLSWFSYLVLLCIISIITYLSSNIHINILYISFYLYILNHVMRLVYKKYGWLPQEDG